MVTDCDPSVTLLLRYRNVLYYVLCTMLKGTLKECSHFAVPSSIHVYTIQDSDRGNVSAVLFLWAILSAFISVLLPGQPYIFLAISVHRDVRYDVTRHIGRMMQSVQLPNAKLCDHNCKAQRCSAVPEDTPR